MQLPVKIRINHGPTLVIHGGAGTILKENFPPEEQENYREALRESLQRGLEVLKAGGTAMEAAIAAVVVMEDSPLFNAGKGSVFTISGKNELEASVMEGRTLRAGAATLLHTTKNPILLAGRILSTQTDPEHPTPHNFLGGKDAEKFACEQGLEQVDPEYFFTKWRWRQHKGKLDHPEISGPMGTVGATCVDAEGNIATATSTGGRNNKWDGRIGDTPLIGAGTWAENSTCGCSGTGNGEFFMRFAACHDVAARMKYLDESVQEACNAVIENLRIVGGEGGIIAVDKFGEFAMPMNSEGMYRGYIRLSDNIPHVALFADEHI